MTITTDTHEIRARYRLADFSGGYEIAISGYTLDEIIDDMIKFLDWLPGLATPFEVTDNIATEDGFQVVIEGEGFRFNEDGDPTDETDRMTITIEGEKK